MRLEELHPDQFDPHTWLSATEPRIRLVAPEEWDGITAAELEARSEMVTRVLNRSLVYDLSSAREPILVLGRRLVTAAGAEFVLPAPP